MELFQNSMPVYEPLASRMRPRNLSEYIGQEHILGEGRLLRRAIQADQLSSLLFSGPPGTGKTTLAKVIAATTKSSFLSLNAVLSGVKEIRELIDQAKELRTLRGKKTILFVDEVHRWNKAQQDALLPWVENGTFILIGATTENPYFEVNAALVSRSRIFLLKPLSPHNLRDIADQALKDESRGYGKYVVQFEDGALEHLVNTSSGDARSLLNALELAVETSVSPFPPAVNSVIHVTKDAAEESIQKKAVLYDKDGDYHFDTISAFIKSLRGSDPDAALYWLAKMVYAGEDPQFIWRRMLISASEDVGLADPQALPQVAAAAQAFHHVGMPEGQFHLAQAALYLATCPKSNSTLGYFDALKAIEEDQLGDVPNKLKDSHRDKKGFGHGADYQYPHSFKDHWVAQRYLPQSLKKQIFYQPGPLGYEEKIAQDVYRRREALLQLTAQESPEDENTLTYAEEQSDPWIKRLGEIDNSLDKKIREHLFTSLDPKRHHLIWIIGDKTGTQVLQALRTVPEGQVFATHFDQHLESRLKDYLQFVPALAHPVFVPHIHQFSSPSHVDRILADLNFIQNEGDLVVLLKKISTQGKVVFYGNDLLESSKLSNFLSPSSSPEAEIFKVLEAEYLAQKMRWKSFDVKNFHHERDSQEFEKKITARIWENWWDESREGGLPYFVVQSRPDLREWLGLQKKSRFPSSIRWKKTWEIFFMEGLGS